jgi:hypothetical protein
MHKTKPFAMRNYTYRLGSAPIKVLTGHRFPGPFSFAAPTPDLAPSCPARRTGDAGRSASHRRQGTISVSVAGPFSIMTVTAERLQGSEPELVPIARKRRVMVGNRRRRDAALLAAEQDKGSDIERRPNSTKPRSDPERGARRQVTAPVADLGLLLRLQVKLLWSSRAVRYTTPGPGCGQAASASVTALVQIAGAGKRPVLCCRDFKLGARHSTLQAQVDLGHPDVPVRIVPCGCDASIRCRRS